MGPLAVWPRTGVDLKLALLNQVNYGSSMLTCVIVTGGSLAGLQDVASGVPLRMNPGSQPGSPMTGTQQQQVAAPPQQPAETHAAGQQCLRGTRRMLLSC